MKYLIKNKQWNIAKDYNIEKLLYLSVDRPTKVDTNSMNSIFVWKSNNNNIIYRNYDLPEVILQHGQNLCDLWWGYKEYIMENYQ